jgi:hypothetical protein
MIARGTYQARRTVYHPSTAKIYIHIAVIRERRQLVVTGSSLSGSQRQLQTPLLSAAKVRTGRSPPWSEEPKRPFILRVRLP